MGITTRHQQPLYLDHEKADALAQLATTTRVPKQVLLREAVDDLLKKHKVKVGKPAKTKQR
jgi:predicted transcriptional regulator